MPGHREHEPWRPFQHLEKRCFDVGGLGFPVFDTLGGKLGMGICNDRRWPETFRVMGLQDVEMVLLGYNTPHHYPPSPEHDGLQDFHNHLAMPAGAYQIGTWVVGVAKARREEGCDLIGGTCIIAPTGEIARITRNLVRGGELIEEPEHPYLDLELNSPLEQLSAAAVRYRIAVGPQAGRKTMTLRNPRAMVDEATSSKPFTAGRDGVSINAGVDCESFE